MYWDRRGNLSHGKEKKSNWREVEVIAILKKHVRAARRPCPEPACGMFFGFSSQSLPFKRHEMKRETLDLGRPELTLGKSRSEKSREGI